MNNALYADRTVMVIILVGISAILLGIFYSYHYKSLSDEIANQAAGNIRSNVEIESHDISEILKKSVGSIMDNLQLIAESPSLQDNYSITASFNLLDSGQQISSDLTDFYMWLDNEGKIVWVSNMNESAYQKYRGTDLSYRDYFYVPKQTLSTYYSNVIDSNDNIPRLFISYPILKNMSVSREYAQFDGIITAGIRVDSLGMFLQSTLPSKYNSSIGFVGENGTILYASANRSLIGLNAFGDEFQATLPSVARDSFNTFLQESLIKSMPNVYDLEYQRNTISIANTPIILDNHNLGTLYVSAPHTLAESVRNITDQQTLISTIIYGIIALIALGIAFVILTSKRRLQAALKRKTIDLKNTIDKLRRSNEMLLTTQQTLTTVNKDLQQANEQLKQHDKMQQDFINTAAHELRTPTQSIIGYTELLQYSDEFEKYKDSGILHESIQAIGRNAVRLKDLTNAMLDVARIESGTLKLKKETVNLNVKVKNVIREISTTNRLLREKNLSLIFVNEENNDNSQYYVNADKSRIFQVISNLIDNAIKFSDKDGKILVSIKKMVVPSGSDNIQDKKEEQAVIRIKDNGRGIDPWMQSRLFTKFATKSDFGTGLGLFIAKNIVEAHGGRIWADNNAQGNGATFEFSLPVI